MSLKNKPTLYHGSPRKINGERLTGERISATPIKIIAMLHSTEGVSHLGRTQISYKGLFGAKKYILRMSGDDLKNLKKPGWIYIVDSKGFEPNPQIGKKHSEIEWNSFMSSAKIVKRMKVLSLYEFMKKHPGEIEIRHKRGPFGKTILGVVYSQKMSLKDIDDYLGVKK